MGNENYWVVYWRLILILVGCGQADGDYYFLPQTNTLLALISHPNFYTTPHIQLYIITKLTYINMSHITNT
jgi:hypothetical protein